MCTPDKMISDILNLMFNSFFQVFQTGNFYFVLNLIWGTLALWLPILLFAIFIEMWVKYIQSKALAQTKHVLLEIKLPRDVFKSPLAMEIILTSLQIGGAGDFLKSFIKGNFQPWFTLELVSIEGNVHFYIWTQQRYRQLIESQFYAQYPGVEIYEAEDYTKQVFFDPSVFGMWGTSFKLSKPDIYPIKTYVDYGLDKNPKEEEKTDPMTSVLEFLGSLKAGQQVWLQILIRSHRKRSLSEDAVLREKPDWKDAAKKEIKKVLKEAAGPDSDETGKIVPLTPGQRDVIAALERNLGKIPFEAGVRGCYIARNESFDPVGITGLIGSFRQYNSETLNGFKLSKFTDVKYPWQNFRGQKVDYLKKKFLNAYKLRSFFMHPYKHAFAEPFILTTEELATIFHLPGRVLGTPTVTKIPSKKSEAPSNLPI